MRLWSAATLALFLALLPTAGHPAAAADLAIGPAPAPPDQAPEAAHMDPPPDLLPDSRVAHGWGPVVRAWLSTPTDRYPHGALGDGLEASALAIGLRDGGVLRLDLPADAVFEDLEPRVVDLDGDERDEAVLLVHSDPRGGAAPAIVHVVDGRVGLTVGPALGTPDRWLNPIGVADLDGDGRMEIAVVETPHIGGTLRVHGWRDGGFMPLAADTGYSNHAFGSTILALHAIADLSGDGRPEILVPGADRRSLKMVSLTDGALTVLQSWDLPSAVKGPVSVTADRGVLVPLEDGTAARVTRSP